MTALPVAADDSGLARDRELIRAARTTGRVRGLVAGTLLACVCVVALCGSIAVGDFPIPLGEVVASLLGGGSADMGFIVRELRLPRALVCVLAGAAFGLSGAIFQSLARNPLASPDVIGITSGAATAAVLTIVVFDSGGGVLSLGAIGGALATATVIYLLAYRRGVTPYRLVLIGIGIGALLGAVTEYLLLKARIDQLQRAIGWLTGSVSGRGWEHVDPLAAALLVLVPAALLLTPALRSLQLGDEVARGLGVRVEAARASLVLTGVALAAVATAAAGPVAFVAFVAPPIARRLVDAPLSMIPAALVGASLMLLADLAGRELFTSDMPVGIVTGLVGAPYLVWLLARANRVGTGG